MTKTSLRELGKYPDGRPVRGYEVDYRTTREDWDIYTTDLGDLLKVKNVVIKVFRLVDENDEPSFDPSGDPEYFINSTVTVVARKEE